MTALALRSIGSNDFAVIDDGYPVGRIRLAAERGGQTWMWNCTIPAPGAPSGTAGSLDDSNAGLPIGGILPRWYPWRLGNPLSAARL